MSQIVVIRHAHAEERELAHRQGLADSERGLTEQGRAAMQEVAKGLRHALGHLDLLATSPLRRAVETADFVGQAFAPLRPVECEALLPGAHPEELLDWLRTQQKGCIAVVGHEPDLSVWVSWVLTGDAIPLLRFKRGGACLLEFPGGKWRAGEAILQWVMTPAQLSQLGPR